MRRNDERLRLLSQMFAGVVIAGLAMSGSGFPAYSQ